MASDYSFSVMPSVSISRSRFNRKSQHKTSFNLGQIIPIYCDEVLPGDTRTFDMATLVRMSTPIAPIMDNIYLDIYAFFVPNRIVWDHWKEFMGENNVSAGIPASTYSVPYLACTNTGAGAVNVGSYADLMGLPVLASNSLNIFSQNKISALPFRGLAKIYNRWFRNENLIAPLAVQTGDTNEVLVGELSNYSYSYFACNKNSVLKAAKLPDYFTKCLPYAQKGSAVSVPIGTAAPIYVQIGTGAVANNTYNMQISPTASQISAGAVGLNVGAGNLKLDNTGSGSDTAGGMFADLSQATAATINQLRYAFQLQKLLEKDALYGTRYWEILAAHFGVTAPDASLQDPEYLGGQRVNINIDQVLSTAGYANTSSTTVGAPGANSVSGWKGSLFTKSFVEHGYIIICAVARHDQTYAQGINRMWTRQSRYDFYFPVFANLGAQDVKLKEIFARGTSADDTLFGYQEAWAEYRYKPSIATALLNPNAANSLDYWTLTNKFSAAPTLGQAFVEQSRDNLARALVTGATGPDFIADFYFQDVAVRPMPVYSIPGLIDHH
jgi:hypothetical protein